jgi:hypothetical protein
VGATIRILYKTENIAVKNLFGTRLFQWGTENQVGQLQKNYHYYIAIGLVSASFVFSGIYAIKQGFEEAIGDPACMPIEHPFLVTPDPLRCIHDDHETALMRPSFPAPQQ